MHDAYEPVPILEKLPLQIDCLAAWGEYLTEGFCPCVCLLSCCPECPPGLECLRLGWMAQYGYKIWERSEEYK